MLPSRVSKGPDIAIVESRSVKDDYQGHLAAAIRLRRRICKRRVTFWIRDLDELDAALAALVAGWCRTLQGCRERRMQKLRTRSSGYTPRCGEKQPSTRAIDSCSMRGFGLGLESLKAMVEILAGLVNKRNL
eukprot:CAMPEP_0114109158 /NCGR_PEP_ID=MMETSP0043_2-20121206/624_1 /TAXON_ID=464988 /ORGANISM="Hemiselmis andersenii, Strain CCMP644" /LENGTH=131 /DNA_ID=CAMNT_0001201011 /DNA_START=555 /DNA_END=950 /DNA_ORIENTATION=-